MQRTQSRMLKARCAAAHFGRSLRIKQAAIAQQRSADLEGHLERWPRERVIEPAALVDARTAKAVSHVTLGPAPARTASRGLLGSSSSERRFAAERTLWNIRAAAAARERPPRLAKTMAVHWWDTCLDDAVYGAQAAAHMLQVAWRRHLRVYHRRSSTASGGGGDHSTCSRYAEHHTHVRILSSRAVVL